jgi:hypothetical protein
VLLNKTFRYKTCTYIVVHRTLVSYQKTTPGKNPKDFTQYYDRGGSLQSHTHTYIYIYIYRCLFPNICLVPIEVLWGGDPWVCYPQLFTTCYLCTEYSAEKALNTQHSTFASHTLYKLLLPSIFIFLYSVLFIFYFIVTSNSPFF